MKRGNKRVHLRLLYNFLQNRKGIVTEYLPWLLIAILTLVVLAVVIFILKGQGIGLADKIKNIFGGR